MQVVVNFTGTRNISKMEADVTLKESSYICKSVVGYGSADKIEG